MAHVKFYMRTYKDDAPKKLGLYLSFDSISYKRFTTNIHVRPSDWDKRNARLKTTCIQRRVIQPKLDELLVTIENELENMNGSSFYSICSRVSSLVKPGASKTISGSIIQVYDKFLSLTKIAPNTIKKHKATKDRLERFYGSKMRIEQLNPINFEEWKQGLFNEGLVDDTVAKHVKNLRRVLSWSFNMEIHDNKIFQKPFFTISLQSKSDQVSLSLHDVELLTNLTVNQFQEKVRDLFLIMLYTGQRWSEVANFRKQDFDGNVWNVRPKKTQNRMTDISIPMVGWIANAKPLIEKYSGDLPKLTEQYFNREIKEICLTAGIDERVRLQRFYSGNAEFIECMKFEKVSAHTARRSFVTIMANELGLPLNLIMEITGHKSLRTLQKYLQPNTTQLIKALEKTKSGI